MYHEQLKIKLKDVPLGCYFIHQEMLCYKDYLTIGTDTNYCIVADTFMGKPRHWLARGYSTDSTKLLVTIVDERYIPILFNNKQLQLF